MYCVDRISDRDYVQAETHCNPLSLTVPHWAVRQWMVHIIATTPIETQELNGV